MTPAPPATAKNPGSLPRVGLLVLVGGASLLWLVGLLILWAALNAPVFEPYSRHADLWTVAGETRSVGLIDASYGAFEPAWFADGRVYLTAYPDEKHTSSVSFVWNAQAERLERVASIPPRAPPPGGDPGPNSTILYTPRGRVLLRDSRGTWKLFDHEWRALTNLPYAVNRSFAEPNAVDLSDGGLLLVVASDPPDQYYAGSVTLVEPGQGAGPELWNHPMIDPKLVFAGPDRKVALLAAGRPPVLWDPRTQKSEPLRGPSPLRGGAAGIAIDASHVLFVGGDSGDDRRPNRAFYPFAATLLVWGAIGVLAAFVLFVRLGRDVDAVALRWYAAGGMVAAVVIPVVVLLLLASLIDSHAFHM